MGGSGLGGDGGQKLTSKFYNLYAILKRNLKKICNLHAKLLNERKVSSYCVSASLKETKLAIRKCGGSLNLFLMSANLLPAQLESRLANLKVEEHSMFGHFWKAHDQTNPTRYGTKSSADTTHIIKYFLKFSSIKQT